MYALYNKRTNRYLTHPKIGLWFTNDLSEAEDMLYEFRRYLETEDMAKVADLEIRLVSANEDSIR